MTDVRNQVLEKIINDWPVPSEFISSRFWPDNRRWIGLLSTKNVGEKELKFLSTVSDFLRGITLKQLRQGWSKRWKEKGLNPDFLNREDLFEHGRKIHSKDECERESDLRIVDTYHKLLDLNSENKSKVNTSRFCEKCWRAAHYTVLKLVNENKIDEWLLISKNDKSLSYCRKCRSSKKMSSWVVRDLEEHRKSQEEDRRNLGIELSEFFYRPTFEEYHKKLQSYIVSNGRGHRDWDRLTPEHTLISSPIISRFLACKYAYPRGKNEFDETVKELESIESRKIEFFSKLLGPKNDLSARRKFYVQLGKYEIEKVVEYFSGLNKINLKTNVPAAKLENWKLKIDKVDTYLKNEKYQEFICEKWLTTIVIYDGVQNGQKMRCGFIYDVNADSLNFLDEIAREYPHPQS